MKIQEGDLEVELMIQFWIPQIQMTIRYLSRDSKKEFAVTVKRRVNPQDTCWKSQHIETKLKDLS